MEKLVPKHRWLKADDVHKYLEVSKRHVGRLLKLYLYKNNKRDPKRRIAIIKENGKSFYYVKDLEKFKEYIERRKLDAKRSHKRNWWLYSGTGDRSSEITTIEGEEQEGDREIQESSETGTELHDT